jgi:hypothetical protein
LIKGTIHQKDITIVNIYAPMVSTSNIIKQTLLDIKEQIDSNTIIMGDFNILLSQVDRSPRQNNQQRNFRIK